MQSKDYLQPTWPLHTCILLHMLNECLIFTIQRLFSDASLMETERCYQSEAESYDFIEGLNRIILPHRHLVANFKLN